VVLFVIQEQYYPQYLIIVYQVEIQVRLAQQQEEQEEQYVVVVALFAIREQQYPQYLIIVYQVEIQVQLAQQVDCQEEQYVVVVALFAIREQQYPQQVLTFGRHGDLQRTRWQMDRHLRKQEDAVVVQVSHNPPQAQCRRRWILLMLIVAILPLAQ
jgi:hypothetical protein